MGLYAGLFFFVVGVLVIIFSNSLSRVFRPHAGFKISKQKGVSLNETLSERFGDNKAGKLVKLIGVVVIILSVGVFLTDKLP